MFPPAAAVEDVRPEETWSFPLKCTLAAAGAKKLLSNFFSRFAGRRVGGCN